MNNIPYYVLSALAVLIILSVHEYAHGYVAYRLGDNTAKNFGRLTLNPIKHLDPVGALCMIFFHIGWAKPVPVNARNFKNPKKDFAKVAIAGPLSNIIMAFFSAFLYLLIFALFRDKTFNEGDFTLKLLENTLLFISLFHTINVGLGVFNLLPIPPFDGSRILNVILPEKAYFAIMKHERKIYFGVLIWLLCGGAVASAIRMLPFVQASSLLYNLAGIFSLSDMLSAAIGFISNLMMNFWQLIPFLKI
ncbi:MAG: site-2 protease family protein [Clostridia bacterium]|nr:site-2 protease family protein [Clostridia bacterium]